MRRNPQLRQAFLQEHVPKLRGQLSEREKIQRSIYDLLKQELPGAEELLDLFSGEPSAVLPLAADGSLKELTLLDHGPDVVVNLLSAGLIQVLKGQKRMSVQELKLAIQPGVLVPKKTRDVTLLESGITLPPENRLSRINIPPDHLGTVDSHRAQAPFYRSAQIGETSVTFGDVLASLGETPRTLRLVDTPVVGRPLSSDDHRQYVETFAQRAGWQIEKWTPLFEGSPSSYGVLSLSS